MRVSAVARRRRTLRPPAARDGRRAVEHARERLDAAGRRPRGRARRCGCPSGNTRTTSPWRSSASAERRAARRPGTKRKFARDGSGSSPSARSARARRSRSSTTGVTSGGDCERRERERGGERRDRARRLARVQLRARCRRRRARSRRARRRARTPSRTCGSRRRRRRSGRAAVSPQYSKYASSTTSGRAVGQRRRARRSGCSAGSRTSATGSSSPTSAPASHAPMRKSGYVGSSAIATVSPGPANARAQSRIRSSAPAPSTTFSGATPA